jgi:glycine amidinotransferase
VHMFKKNHNKNIPVLSTEDMETGSCPVNSYNEWDPLEEVIVGRLEGAAIPPRHLSVTFSVPPFFAQSLRIFGGRRYPRLLLRPAQQELEGFIRVLEAEGVTVRRPAIKDFSVSYRTPAWKSRGFCVACPRDGFMVLGDEIIETPMSWRSRYFEAFAYRPLFKEYFAQGARWTAAPRPELADALYDQSYTPPGPGEPLRYVTTEYEPVFDAADFVRCGRDLFYIRSNVTNEGGIRWLERHLGDRFRLHRLETSCRTPMHIDSSFMPLAPGKVLVNPEFIDVRTLPPILKSWDLLICPEPGPMSKLVISMVSKWIAMNVLMLDERRVIVEQSAESLIKALKDWGFDPIPLPFLKYAPFGGSFHCATLDIRRRGELQSYF